MSPLVSMIGIGIVHRSMSTALVLFSSLLSHWASSSSYFPTSLSSSSMSMMSTITITIQRFFFSCCCSFFFFFYSIHAISSTAVEIFFYPLTFHVHLVSIHPSIHPSSDHCYDDPHRTALYTLTHGWFLVCIFVL